MDDLEKMANDKKQQSQNPLMRMWNALWQRNGKQMSVEQKMRLIKLLSEINNED